MKKLSIKQKIRQIRLCKLREKHRIKRKQKSFVFKDIQENDLNLPPNLDFSKNFDATMLFFNELRDRALVKGEKVRLNFNHIKGISPAASIVLIAEIYRCWKFHDRKVLATGARQCKISSQLQEMGFYDLLNARNPRKKVSNQSSKQYISFQTATQDVGEIADEIRQAVYNECPTSLSEQTKDMLYKGLVESMSNVSSHAYNEQFKNKIVYPYNDKRWWVSGYVDKSKHEVMIQFYDQGAGIASTLPSKLTEKVLNSITGASAADLIKLATNLGESSTKEKNRGKGLPQIVDVIKNTKKGKLRIISNNGEYIIRNNPTKEQQEEELRTFKNSLGGTLIQWKVSDNE